MFLVKINKLLLLACFFTFSTLLAVGSGGVLNLVSHAKVYKNDVEQKDWKAYVHPFEGSLVIVPDKGDICWALDKAKWISFSFKKTSLVSTGSIDKIDVPENIVIVEQKLYPAFSRNWAETELDDGTKLRIVVDR